MNDVAANTVQFPSAKDTQASSFDRRVSTSLIVIAAALLLFGAAMSRSLYDGRMGSPITHDDVNYFIIGIRRLSLLRTQGFLALLDFFIHVPEHSPLRTYQATFAFLIFGINDWAPYASNIVLVLVFLGVGAFLVRDLPVVALAACLAGLIALPLSSDLAFEFSPELMCSLFTAIGVVLMLRLPLLDAPSGPRFRASLCFGVGFLSHPVASAFTLIALLGTVGWMFVRDIFLAGNYRNFWAGFRQSLLILLLSLWLPILYMAPGYETYWRYFNRTILDPATAWRWASPHMPLRQQLAFYTSGSGGNYMFGNRAWAYAAMIGAGLAAAWWRRDRKSLVRQAELVLLIIVPLWVVPTLAPVKNAEFASCFGFAVALLAVLGMHSIYQTLRGVIGAVVLSAIAFLLLVSDVSLPHIDNTPRTLIEREFAFDAINRLSADLFGNATDYRGTKVYMTNIGAYANNILQYYMLKVDPTLSWNFDSGVTVSDAKEQLDFIRASQQDFVIAGHRDSGFTYSGWAQPAEDPALAALSSDPRFMPIDRFYGPHGRTVTVFQRRGNFAGWRPVSGISNPSGEPDGVRVSTGGVAYLQAYATRPISAELQLECTGTAGQTIDILVNQQKIGELVLSADTGSGLFDQPITLSTGTNHVVLQYPTSAKVTLHHLWIIRQMAPQG
jgi:hypothetical protein